MAAQVSVSMSSPSKDFNVAWLQTASLRAVPTPSWRISLCNRSGSCLWRHLCSAYWRTSSTVATVHKATRPSSTRPTQLSSPATRSSSPLVVVRSLPTGVVRAGAVSLAPGSSESFCYFWPMRRRHLEPIFMHISALKSSKMGSTCNLLC